MIAALAAHGGTASGWLVGEPCVEPPEVVREALVLAARSPSFPYPPAAGLPRLREVLADRHREGGAPASPEQIVVTAGAKAGLLALLAALLEPGDELIHPLPCYPAYPAMARRLGAQPVPVPESGGSFDGWTEAVAGRIGPRTRAVVLASPSNPSGATLTSDQAQDLVELCRDRGVRLICDEAYGAFRFAAGTEKIAADFDPRRHTVVQLQSVSKTWALCGWRIGWVVADADLAAAVAARHTALLNPASGPPQAAMATLPRVPGAYLEAARAAVQGRVESVVAGLQGNGLEVRRPSGGFYLWLDIEEIAMRAGVAGSPELCLTLARDHGVGLWPGEDFGGSLHVRLAVTAPTPERWDEALGNLLQALR